MREMSIGSESEDCEGCDQLCLCGQPAVVRVTGVNALAGEKMCLCKDHAKYVGTCIAEVDTRGHACELCGVDSPGTRFFFGDRDGRVYCACFICSIRISHMAAGRYANTVTLAGMFELVSAAGMARKAFIAEHLPFATPEVVQEVVIQPPSSAPAPWGRARVIKHASPTFPVSGVK